MLEALEDERRNSAPADRIARWLQLAFENGFVDFLSPEDGFKICLNSRRAWANKDQPGIYFWLASDGEAYVGQSVTPQSRLRQHWRDYRDISHACFMPCELEHINLVEEELISQLGKYFPLRNIKHALTTVREVPFDKLISEEEREYFLSGHDLADQPWRDFDLLTRLQSRKFDKFVSVEGGLETLAAARTFVNRALPKPAATEVGFWSITLFPSKRFLRVNAGQQEVFTCAAGRDRSGARVLTDKRIRLLHSYNAGYRIPSYVTSMAPRALQDWLAGDALLSCRRLVVRLMRHTTTLNSGSHCPQVVRAHDAAA